MVFDKINDVIKKVAEEKEQSFNKESILSSFKSGMNKKEIFFNKPEQEDVEEKNTDSGIDPRIVAYYTPKSEIVEQYRTLWAHILSLNIGKTLKTIAITSSSPLEGKTVTAINLSIIMAQTSEKNVLLVDCNLHNPAIHKFLGLVPTKGLSDILMESALVDSALLKTDVTNLTILPGRKISVNPSELITSERMRTLLAELKSQFDYIILDASPVVPYADPRLLASLVDGILLVVQAGKTRREVIQRTESILSNVGSKILGYVLTGVEYHIPEYIHKHL